MNDEEILSQASIKKVRGKMKLGVHYINADTMLIHPSWFLNKDESPMDENQKLRRFNAIKRLINIKKMEVGRWNF